MAETVCPDDYVSKRQRVTLTLDSDIVRSVDERAKLLGQSRSMMVELMIAQEMTEDD